MNQVYEDEKNSAFSVIIAHKEEMIASSDHIYHKQWLDDHIKVPF